MVSHGYEHEELRRKRAGIPTRRWYKCSTCGSEYSMLDGARNSAGCSNPCCAQPDLHIHSDLDGEKPKTL